MVRVVELALTTLVIVGLLAAAAWDVRARRIPNGISAAVLLLAVIRQLTFAGPSGLALGLVVGLGVLALLWQPWLRGRIGGGDVKLAVAAGVVVGWPEAPLYLGVSALAGGVLAIVCYALSSSAVRREVRTNLQLAASGHTLDVPAGARPGSGRVSVPYGVSFVVGALVCMWRQGA